MVAANGKAKKMGRPVREFTREELDAAQELMGREFFSSRIVGRLVQKFKSSGMGRDLAYRLLEEARADLMRALAATDGNPVATLWAGSLAMAADPKVSASVRVQALNGAAKMLGVYKFAKDLQEAGDVEAFLAAVMERRAARAGETGGRE